MHSYISVVSALLLSSTSLFAAVPTTIPAPQMQPVAHAETASVPVHSNLSVNRFVLATGVSAHEPQGIKDTFSVQDGRVFAFAELSSYGHDHVTFHWKHEGKTYTEFKATVKDSKRWRTFSSVKALAGAWSVALQDSQGTLLKEMSFNVGHDGASSTVHDQPVGSVKQDEKPAGIKEVLTSLEPEKAKAAS